MAAEVQNPFKTHPRIFVVDDELTIAKMMSVILQMNLFDAVPFSDPAAALDAARVDPPDYLISDIAMQGMTGIELAVLVQTEIPSCKILLFSGQVGAAEMIQDAKREGHSFAFLQKPIHPSELVKVIKSLNP
jgi:FixJ family two-component response regulator